MEHQPSPDQVKLFEQVMANADKVEEGFELACEDTYFKVYKKVLKDGGGLITKSFVTFDNIPIDDLAVIILDEDFRKKWDQLFSGPRILEKIDSISDIFYFQVEAPVMLVSKRDFVVKRYTFKDFKGVDYFVFMESVETPLMPVQKGTVRAKMVQNVRVLRKTPDGKGSTLIVLAQVDLGGMIPQWVINKEAGSVPKKNFGAIKEKYASWKAEGSLEAAKKKK